MTPLRKIATCKQEEKPFSKYSKSKKTKVDNCEKVECFRRNTKKNL